MSPSKTSKTKKAAPIDESSGATCNCAHYARATEAAALASARWLGRADREGAEEAAFAAMQNTLSGLSIDGRILGRWPGRVTHVFHGTDSALVTPVVAW